MMTKTDFETVAAVLHGVMDATVACQGPTDNNADKWYDAGRNSAVMAVAVDLAVKFEENNPRFDRQKFLTACGV